MKFQSVMALTDLTWIDNFSGYGTAEIDEYQYEPSQFDVLIPLIITCQGLSQTGD